MKPKAFNELKRGDILFIYHLRELHAIQIDDIRYSSNSSICFILKKGALVNTVSIPLKNSTHGTMQSVVHPDSWISTSLRGILRTIIKHRFRLSRGLRINGIRYKDYPTIQKMLLETEKKEEVNPSNWHWSILNSKNPY